MTNQPNDPVPERVWLIIENGKPHASWSEINVFKFPFETHVEYVSASVARQQVEDMKRERDDLGAAIAQTAIKVGIIDGSIALDGPQLILLCDDLSRVNTQAVEDMKVAMVAAARSAFDQGPSDSPIYHDGTMVKAGAMERAVVKALEAVEIPK